MTIGPYLTPETIRLLLSGVAAGSAVGLGWRLAGRLRWGGVPFVFTVFAAARYARRYDWPQWNAMAAFGVVVLLLAVLGASRLLADPAIRWEWVAAGSLISAVAVWAAVPETGPALLTGGGLTGLVTVAILTGARWGPSAAAGVAAVLGWGALSGAAGRPWAAVGGALCTGVAPWYSLLLPLRFRRCRRLGPWLLGAHTLLVVLAARWIGVDPDPGWWRVIFLALMGTAVAIAGGTRA